MRLKPEKKELTIWETFKICFWSLFPYFIILAAVMCGTELGLQLRVHVWK